MKLRRLVLWRGRREQRGPRERRERRSRTAPLGPELSGHTWHTRATELAETGMLTMSRQLPALVGQVMRLGWRANRADLAVTVAFNVIAGVFTAFGLLATTGVLTALFSAGPTPDKVRAAAPQLLMVGAAVTIRAACAAVAQWAQARLRPQVQQIVELRLYEVTTAVELAAFDDAGFQDDLHRARLRGAEAAPLMVDHTVDLLTAVVGVAAAAGALGVLHPLLLPLLLLTALPEAWAAVAAARLGYLTQLNLVEVQRRSWIMADLMTERLHAAEVRSFTVRGFLLRRYTQLAGHIRAVSLDLAWRQTVTRVCGDVLKGVAIALMYAALGTLLWRGVMPLAVAGTAVLAIRAGQTSLVNLIYSLNRCYEDGLYFSDYLGYCRRAEAGVRRARDGRSSCTAPEALRQIETLKRFQEISAEEVTFTYPGGTAPSLHEVSVRLRRGEIVALVGENGSGKTTLAKVLAGLYLPQRGHVRWDDLSVNGLDPEVVRGAIAVVAQDHTHWPMTAADNITMGDDVGVPAVRRSVDQAVAAAGADEVIADLPYGLDTLLDKRFHDGLELSGGQWQRLAAARGFYRDAPLLICDEPTAALDARAEHHLFDKIRAHAARRGRTVLLITHRLASVRHADRIYVLSGGRITEHGTHAQLMRNGGLYAELYDLQASAYRPAERTASGGEHGQP
ncbi:ABC transporter ATP-binding protein [Actinomadura graeca]|uniref:ABC transporter ATP-binding protein n=1 Tax=Actinomadura graeca TaxID=2750812 RepID=A0ABX8R479_9ACTN|nr:ABC transporter ATP-binding protein [Actinomadura graeca]QXJ23813.1 ABC transporter ATP-binding protein [Actinomadura graeca]